MCIAPFLGVASTAVFEAPPCRRTRAPGGIIVRNGAYRHCSPGPDGPRASQIKQNRTGFRSSRIPFTGLAIWRVSFDLVTWGSLRVGTTGPLARVGLQG